MEELKAFLQTILEAIDSVRPEGVTLQESLLQLSLVGALCACSLLIRRRLHPSIASWCEIRPRWESARRILEPLVWPLIWFVLVSILLGIYLALGWMRGLSGFSRACCSPGLWCGSCRG